jgi:hypothetical protein
VTASASRFDRAGRFGEGITAEDMHNYVWVRPEMVVEVRFTEWAQAGALRHPEVAHLIVRVSTHHPGLRSAPG